MVQATFDAASHVIEIAKILKTVTMTKLALTRVANANTIPTNVHPVDIRVVSVADQVPESAVAPPAVAADPAVAIWSLTVQQESRDTMDSLSRLTRVSNLKWTKWTVSQDNAQVRFLIHRPLFWVLLDGSTESGRRKSDFKVRPF